jgi:hypothetical protein
MENTLKQTVRDFSKASEAVQTIIVALLAILVPTFLAKLITMIFGADSVITNNSQIIVGSIVNTALIVTALNLKGWSKTVFVVTMPSVSTILSGYVFKSASPLMSFMIPAIWIGNFLLVYAFKYIVALKEKNYFIAAAVGIISKVIVIFGFFMILKAFGVFPEKIAVNLQKAMGIIQLITATIGSILAYVIYKLETKSGKE